MQNGSLLWMVLALYKQYCVVFEKVHVLGSTPRASAIPDSFYLCRWTTHLQPLLTLSSCLGWLLCIRTNTSEQPPLHFSRSPHVSLFIWSLLSPGCQLTTSPVYHHGILKVDHQTHHEHFIIMYLSRLLKFFRVMPRLFVVCLPNAKCSTRYTESA